MAKKPKWKNKPTGLKADGVPPMGKVMKTKVTEEAQDDEGKKGALTMDEKLQILEMYQEESDTTLIAQKFNRSPEAIRKFLWRYKDTSQIARQRIQGGAHDLAERIVEQANVDQALEVMDRLGVLEKKRDKAAPQSSFTLVMGNFGEAAKKGSPVIPIPSQKRIEDAIEAEAKVVTDGKS